eukprot:m.32476 g.32476  ORF g.32476 m.32476 type:complete len:473 (-) comp12154_c0_seq1:75-1493(-)
MAEKLECFAISAADLEQVVTVGNAIVVDVRSSAAFQASHILGALSVRSNPLLLRRLNKGTLSLSDLLLDPEQRWSKRADDDMVVLYDDASAFDGPIDYNPKSMLHAALRSLLFCGLNCVFLHGGFASFRSKFPALTVAEASDPLNSVCTRSSNPFTSPKPVDSPSSSILPMHAQRHHHHRAYSAGDQATKQGPAHHKRHHSYYSSTQQSYQVTSMVHTMSQMHVSKPSYPYLPPPPAYQQQATCRPMQPTRARHQPQPSHGPYSYPEGRVPPARAHKPRHRLVLPSSKTSLSPTHLVAPLSHAEAMKLPMSKILPYLYLGAQRDAQNLQLLKQQRISYILNVTTNVPNYYERDFQYQQIPILDCNDSEIQEFFEIASGFINQARAEGKRVLVHCQAGISRSATLVIAYLMKEQGRSLNDALEYVTSCRSIIGPNFGFLGRLQDYEAQLRGEVKRPALAPSPGDMTAVIPLWS